MSDEQAEIRILDDELVADYLRRHPEFFSGQGDLLLELRIPHARGSSISLVERQLEVLRGRSSDLQQRLQQLLDVARDNDRLYQLTRQLVLDLLESRSLADLYGVLDDGLRGRFAVPAFSLLLFADAPCAAVPVTSLLQARAAIPDLLGDKPLSGVLRSNEKNFLFGEEQAAQLQSVTVAAFGPGPLGVLALGSPDPHQYSSTMGTVFLSFVAEVLARLVPDLLAQEQAASHAG